MKNDISAHTSFQPDFFTSYGAERFPGPGTFIFIAVAAREHFDQLYISQICELDRLPQHKLHGGRISLSRWLKVICHPGSWRGAA